MATETQTKQDQVQQNGGGNGALSKDDVSARAGTQISYEDLYKRWEQGNWKAYDIDFSRT